VNESGESIELNESFLSREPRLLTCDIGDALAVSLTTMSLQYVAKPPAFRVSDELVRSRGFAARELQIEIKSRLAWCLGRYRRDDFSGVVVADDEEPASIPNFWEATNDSKVAAWKVIDGRRHYYPSTIYEIRSILLPRWQDSEIRLERWNLHNSVRIYDEINEGAFIVTEATEGVRCALQAVADSLMLKVDWDSPFMRSRVFSSDPRDFEFP